MPTQIIQAPPEDQADLTSSTPESFPSIPPILRHLQKDVTVSEADSKDAIEDAVETEEPSAQRPPLPAELLCDIVSLCEPASLPSLCLANTILREVASPVLYKSLSFCSPTQAETFLHAATSPRFAQQLHAVTLDRSVELHLHRQHTPSTSSTSLSHYPPLPLPRVRHIHFHVINRTTRELENLLHYAQPLIAPLAPLSISCHLTSCTQSSFDRDALVSSETWTTVAASWSSLRLVVLRGSVVFAETEERIRQMLPWLTTQPTAPLLELDVQNETGVEILKRQGGRAGLRPLLQKIFSCSPVHPSPLPRPLPILTIRLPTEVDRVYFEEKLDKLGTEVKDAVRLVVGTRRLEELE